LNLLNSLIERSKALFSEGIFFVWRRPNLHRPLLTAGLLMWLVASTLVPHAAYAQTEEEAAGLNILISRYKTVPPLPFPGPQIGPLIEPGVEDDVDRRTTAFIPRDLDMLTPIEEMPEDVDRWIRVDLSEQLVIAYEGDQPIRGFVVSTGLPGTPTVTGTFNIRVKVRSQTMSGGSALNGYYNLPNVEWVQYFYADYGFHGTYWHNNFGNPMSHGCINMTNADAKWLFDWAGPTWDGGAVWHSATDDDPGTLVIVHE
jgi:lipoprotein-anchoring transpeptidase ErfK/SrfK